MEKKLYENLTRSGSKVKMENWLQQVIADIARRKSISPRRHLS